MATNLDKSLDDIIGETPRHGGRRGRRQGNNNNASGSNNRDSPNRNSPYARRDGGVQKRGNTGGAAKQQQQGVMFNPAAFMAAAAAAQQQQQLGGASGRIHISNLDFAVSEADLRELFGQVGHVNKAILHCKRDGTSNGTGEVQFRNPAHAAQAVEKYHGMTLDGRPMKIETAFNPLLAAASMMMPAAMMPAPVVAQPMRTGNQAGNTRGRRNDHGGGNRAGSSSGGGAGSNAGSGKPRRGGRSGGRGGRRNDSEKRGPTTKEALDADLDSYMLDAEKPAA
ncbi:hypothetical protein GGI04_003115 [Coemansia thaxteri]|uniref:RRM domain-containing protein n=1 Tax=Coemansia thaxteri TaxID=2663907 RepID=A0A9W8BF00_9FUNG|nr:hypothetical protein GGI04_003115 [Coemansia thaxteri]KAJ2005259.1 hypothetical protein H4R26_002051 [Coemansia thaxteri]KAJ2464802.1 hypothetical protein GGI02_004884 [Coemansia sp. RSA 2322]KAJ2486798.1 hypothetical protein EV174_000902 [Coemansia sp. RSA 2320]